MVADGTFTAQDAVAVAEGFLEASMVPDPDRAQTYLAPDAQITFTSRRFASAHDMARFNKGRYRWVKKKFERTDVAAAGGGTFVVCNTGTLYGEWPDGQAFSGNRYLDRFVVRDGRIVRIDVWNDSAEILLVRAGLAPA